MMTGGYRGAVIGIGNLDRGDDAAGRAVALALRGRLPGSILLAEESGEATALLARVAGMDRAWLIDACVSSAPPGTLHRIDVTTTALPPGFTGTLSSHGFGLAEAIELARALGQLPRQCVVLGIEASDGHIGAALSPPVATAITGAAKLLIAEITGREATGDDTTPCALRRDIWQS